MKYKIWVPSESERSEGPVRVFVIPISADSSKYRIISPRIRMGRILGRVLSNGILIESFGSPFPGAAAAVREGYSSLLSRIERRTEGRSGTVFILGILFAILGVVSWTIPDPLPLVDEVALTVGGFLMAFSGYRSIRRDLPIIADRCEKGRVEAETAEEIVNPVLRRLYTAMRQKSIPETSVDEAADSIEIEARWLITAADAGREAAEDCPGAVSADELAGVFSGAFGFRRLLGRERRNRRTSVLLRRAAVRTGLSEDGLAVLYEFWKAVQAER